jgi:predicted metal-binding protein
LRKKKRTCGHKIKHATFNDAIVAIKKLEKKQFFVHKRVAYKCKHCKKWHVGRINQIHPKFVENMQKLID